MGGHLVGTNSTVHTLHTYAQKKKNRAPLFQSNVVVLQVNASFQGQFKVILRFTIFKIGCFVKVGWANFVTHTI